ncbi:hypothetical protein BJX96DRAFT_155539 [Aspergillus floccosus]
MHFTISFCTLILNVAALHSCPVESAGCGNADACPLTENCATATLTATTTKTSCVPTATCLWVYDTCSWNGQVGNCCSGYCAASKCRSTDSRWPNCQEDNGLCLIDDNCCYGNKCVNGICTRPNAGA